MINKFNERLQQLINDKSITQQIFASKINLSFSTISQWTRGLKQPTADNIIIVAQYFGVTTDYILGVSDF